MTIPMPGRKILTRVALPGVLLVGAGALVGHAAREAWTPSVDVRVAPVVPAAGQGGGEVPGGASPAEDAIVAQAPGWVEASPFPIRVAALTGGVVREVLVLEGQRVEAGEVVAVLVDEDARLEAERARAELVEGEAMARVARAGVEAAEARTLELADEIARKEPLVSAGAFTEAELARLRLRRVALERETSLARAEAELAEARLGVMRVEVDRADLALARTRVVSPAGGVVLGSVVSPGTSVEDDRVVAEVYDPARLQVRADAALADAGKIRVGMRAEIRSEADAGRVWQGRVARVVQQADLQRNTVQFKVVIDDPGGLLQPEMLVRVRFLGEAGGGAEEGVRVEAGEGTFAIDAGSITGREGRSGRVFVADFTEGRSQARGGYVVRVRAREVEIVGEAGGGRTLVRGGLRDGDRVVVAPPPGAIRDGSRVRVIGEGGGA